MVMLFVFRMRFQLFEIFFILVQISQLSLSFQFLFDEMTNNVAAFVINYNMLMIMLFVLVVKILLLSNRDNFSK